MAISHQNNFGTNLTSGTSAGGTTSPLNSIPSVAAPFYIAFDATNINGHYEVKQISSKTATDVLHTALAYNHTTAEEVRMVVPAEEMDALSSGLLPTPAPQGYLINGKIVPSVASNNLTVAIKTLAGTDATTANPIYIRIGDTVRTITAALSVTKNAATNWCNAGSAELATKEIDYFVYLGYNATDGVTIGFSRIPGACQYSDFSVTTTNEKYCAISTITNAAATDYYEVVGRFAATLSAGAGYTWSVPTFTAINLIQRPIFETRFLTFTPAYSGAGSMTFTSVSTTQSKYKISGNNLYYSIHATGTTGGTASNAILVTYPFSPDSVSDNVYCFGCYTDDGVLAASLAMLKPTATKISFFKTAGANYGLGASRVVQLSAIYQI